MEAKSRFTTFGIGALLGVALLWGFNQKADPIREQRRQVMVSLSLPGMYYDHASMQRSLFGHFVLAERRATLPDGGVLREIITGGRNRFDAEGRPLPTDLLFITETYAPGVVPSEDASIKSVTFAYADRAEVVYVSRPEAETLVWDGRIQAEEVGSDCVQLRLRNPSTLKGEKLFVLVDAVRAFEDKPGVLSAQLGLIDWQAEAQQIREFADK